MSLIGTQTLSNYNTPARLTLFPVSLSVREASISEAVDLIKSDCADLGVNQSVDIASTFLNGNIIENASTGWIA